MKIRNLLILSVCLLFCSCDIGTYYGMYAKHDFEKQDNLDSVNTILVIGDSVAAGGGTPYGYSYPYMIKDVTGKEVINKAVCGTCASNGIEQINECEVPFDMCIINFGINDSAFYSLEDFKNNMKQVIEYIKSINSEARIVIITSVMPALPFNMNYRLIRIWQYEDVSYELKEEYENISVVPITGYTINLTKKGRNPTMYTTDCTHPNQKLHREITSLVLFTLSKPIDN